MVEMSWHEYAPFVLLLPVVASFTGWVTNWAAVKMLFWPERFVGIGPIGWQGVIYRHSDKLAEEIAAVTAGRLSVDDILARIDVGAVEEIYDELFQANAPAVALRVCDAVAPGVWQAMSASEQQELIARIREEGRKTIHGTYPLFRDVSTGLIDFHALTKKAISADGGATLVRLIQLFGSKELGFIVLYGAVFGGVIGLIELGVWQALQHWWLLAAVGGLVGASTNWLALVMIFRPYEPRKFGPFTYQGLFPKRQKEIAEDYSREAATRVLTAKNIIEMLSEGETGARLATVAVQLVDGEVVRQSKVLEDFEPLRAIPVDEKIHLAKEAMRRELVTVVPRLRPRIEDYVEEKLNLAGLLNERLNELSKPEFERLLRGMFEQDEVMLIALGGVLGALIGMVQGLVLGLL